jgi:hypothetical protein
VSFFFSSYLLCSYFGGLASELGMLAYAVAAALLKPMLLLLLFCSSLCC